MYYSIVLDVVLLLILILLVHNCWRQGFLASVAKVGGSVASFLLASSLSGPVADWAYEKFLEARIVAAVAEQLPSSVGGIQLDGLSGLGLELSQFRDTVAQLLSQALDAIRPGLGFFSGDSTAAADTVITKLEEGATIAQAVADAAIRPAVVSLLGIAAFFVMFTAAMFLVRILVRMFRGVNRVPLVGGVNRLGGLALGVCYAGVFGYVISLGLALAAGLAGDKIPFLTTPILADTRLIQWFISLKLG